MHWIMLIVALLVSAASFLLFYDESGKLKGRKKQSTNMLRENVIKKRLDMMIEERVSFSRRYRLETLSMQAGFHLSYAELIIISSATALLASIFLFYATKNPLLGIVFLVFGFFLPKQILTMIRNFRVEKMEKQIGSFIHMALKRYEATQDFGKSLHLSTEEFKGEEPVYSELKRMSLSIQLGRPIDEALRDMSRSMGNRYVERLADYYEMAVDAGNAEQRQKLLGQAYEQYEENRQGKMKLKREIANVKRENYIMLAMIPVFAVYQVFTSDEYVRFMTESTMGQIGTAVITGVFLGLLWVINNKIGGPLD